MAEEAVEFCHDSCLHDLSEESILLSQLLGTEVLPAACRSLVVVEEVDEGCVGRLGEQLLIDICEEPGGGGGRPSETPACGTESPPGAARGTQGRHGRAGSGQSGDFRFS